MLNINDEPMVMMLLFHLSRYGAWHTDSPVTTKFFEIDGLPNFLRYDALLSRLKHAGTLL